MTNERVEGALQHAGWHGEAVLQNIRMVVNPKNKENNIVIMSSSYRLSNWTYIGYTWLHAVRSARTMGCSPERADRQVPEHAIGAPKGGARPSGPDPPYPFGLQS